MLRKTLRQLSALFRSVRFIRFLAKLDWAIWSTGIVAVVVLLSLFLFSLELKTGLLDHLSYEILCVFLHSLLVVVVLSFFVRHAPQPADLCANPVSERCAGCIKRIKGSRLHAIGEPALRCTRKTEYRIEGELHREDGPALVWYDAEGNVARAEWFLFGQLHRYDGPAIISTSNGYPWHFSGSGYFLHGVPIDDLGSGSDIEKSMRLLAGVRSAADFQSVLRHAVWTFRLKGEFVLAKTIEAASELVS